jgi:hypothetical protein
MSVSELKRRDHNQIMQDNTYLNSMLFEERKKKNLLKQQLVKRGFLNRIFQQWYHNSIIRHRFHNEHQRKCKICIVIKDR